MRAHDRTLLASLGFNDPDKSEPLHDLACRYLTEPEQALRLVQVSNPTPTLEKDWGWQNGYGSFEQAKESERGDWWEASFSLPRAIFVDRSLEQPISKGSGQYKTTIGFLDGVIRYTHDWSKKTIGRRDGAAVEKTGREIVHPHSRVLLEVKIHPQDASAVLRQVRLYQEYEGGSWSVKHPYVSSDSYRAQSWIVAVRFDVSAAYKAMLAEHGINIVRLGSRFDEWVATAAKSGVGSLEEI